MSKAGHLAAALCMLLAAVAAGGCRREEKPPVAVVLVTPDVAETGFPQHLIAEFRRQSNRAVELRVVSAAEISAAVAAGAKASVVVLTRDDALTRELQRSDDMQLHSAIAVERFVIMGPATDPAHVRDAPSAAEAFRRIASSGQRYCSPVDVKRLMEVERQLWTSASPGLGSSAKILNCRGPAVEALEKTSRLRAYTLSEPEAISNSFRLAIEPLGSGLPPLTRTYTATLMFPDRRNAGSRWFMQWLMSYRGREAVTQYRGEQRLELPR